MTEDQIAICQHEAAHAVAAIALGCQVVRVTAGFPTGNGCRYRGATPEQAAVIAAAGIAWSGMLDPGVGGDALSIVRELKLDDEHLRVQKAAVNLFTDKARALLEQHESAIDLIAGLLIQNDGIVEGGELSNIVRHVLEGYEIETY